MMRYVKSLITLLCISGLCLFLGACSKSDDVIGNKYKAIYNNKVEAIVEFKDNGDLIYTVAEGAFDAGREEHGKYEVIEENGKKFLLTTGISDSKFLKLKYGTFLSEQDGGWDVFLVGDKDKKLGLFETVNMKKTDNREIESKEEIKDLEEIKDNSNTRVLEKMNWFLSIISKYENL